MYEEIKKYLHKVTASIPNPEDAEMVRLELEDHIMTKVELLLLSGSEENNAIHQVLADMGDEEELQEDLGVVHSNHKMCGKIIYENEKAQCQYLAQRLGKELGIPYADARENPRADNCELLIVIRKLTYGGGARPELTKYLQRLKKGRIKIVVMIYTGFCSGNRAIYRLQRSLEEERYFKGNDGQYIKKMLIYKGINAIEERYCFRSYKRLGGIPEQEVMREVRYFAKMLGIYM